MNQTLQLVSNYFGLMISGAWSALAILLFISFPGILESFLENKKLRSFHHGHISIAYMSTAIISIVVMLLVSVYLAARKEPVTINELTYIRERFGMLVVMVVFLPFMLGLYVAMIIQTRRKK